MIVVTWIISALATSVAMDYQPLSVRQLLDVSEWVVLGTVRHVGPEAYTVSPTEQFVGDEPAEEPVTVRRHRYWPGTARWTEPRASQQVLLFLKRDPESSGWRIQGIGGEGEMPVEDAFLYLYGAHLPGLTRASHTVQGASLNVQRIDWATVQDAFAAYACFRQHRTEVPPRDCGERNDLRQHSLLHRLLIDKP